MILYKGKILEILYILYVGLCIVGDVFYCAVLDNIKNSVKAVFLTQLRLFTKIPHDSDTLSLFQNIFRHCQDY